MADDKHTPGPWLARDYKNKDGDIWVDCNAFANKGRGKQLGGTLAIALHTGCGAGTIEANAHLIAAAPDLLAACEASQQCITDLIDAYKRGCSMLVLDEAVKSLRDDALKLTSKALAKARPDPT